MDIVSMLLSGMAVGLTPANLLACAIGVVLGTVVGVLPGIGPVGAIALLLPLSYSMDAAFSLILFTGLYYGAMYGGSTTSILANVPGESASVITCLDGYAMARKGRAGAALAVAAIGSFVAGTMGILGLTFFAPILASFALAFGPPEYFALTVLGLVLLSGLGGTSKLKSFFMVIVGVMLGTVGMDSMTGVNRFTFAVDELQRGVDISILAMGLFGLGEVLDAVVRPNGVSKPCAVPFRELYPNKEEWRRSIGPMFRGGFVGFLIGLVPGPSATLSTFLSYAWEKRRSKTPDAFGKGAIEGVAGPESANNAAASASLIPLLALGLPFAPTAAMLLGGFMIHGIIPGPTLMNEHPDLFWGLLASMYIAKIIVLVINLPLVGIFAALLKTPPNILMPLIVIITMTGTYSINNSFFDVALLVAFGVLGFYMKQTGYEAAPLLLGLILGPTMERGLTQGLIICDGSFSAFFSRPISGSLLVIAVFVMVYQLGGAWHRKNRKADSAVI